MRKTIEIIQNKQLWVHNPSSLIECFLCVWEGIFSGGSAVKNLPAMQETWVQFPGQKIPWRRKWQPTPLFLPRKAHGQRSPAGYSPWGHKESDMGSQMVRHDLVTWNNKEEGTDPMCLKVWVHLNIPRILWSPALLLYSFRGTELWDLGAWAGSHTQRARRHQRKRSPTADG